MGAHLQTPKNQRAGLQPKSLSSGALLTPKILGGGALMTPKSTRGSGSLLTPHASEYSMTRAEFSRLLKEDERAAEAQREREAKAERKHMLQEQKERTRARGQSFRDKEKERIRQRLAFLEAKNGKAGAKDGEAPKSNRVINLANLSSVDRMAVRRLLESPVLPFDC